MKRELLSDPLPQIYAAGRPMDLSAEAFGPLHDASGDRADPARLKRRLDEEGYLFLPGFFTESEVLEVRKTLTDALAAEGLFDPSEPAIKAIVKSEIEMGFRPDIANGNEVLESLIYGPRVIGLFEKMLGGAILHYDFTWLRAVAPGHGTSPHCDIVYMGRGTRNLFTAWVPMGDVPLRVGGLIILESSNQVEELHRVYGSLDVDASCENDPGSRNQLEARGFHESGAIDLDPVALRERLGGRWLTAEYRMGDLLIFGMATIHASLDNRSREVRFSSDSRYQLASEPVDERWIGREPVGHGPRAKKSLIC